MMRPPRRFPLFPYTTLFRSADARRGSDPPLRSGGGGAERRRGRRCGCKTALGLPPTAPPPPPDRKSTRLNSSHANISYAVFCLKKKIKNSQHTIESVCPILR